MPSDNTSFVIVLGSILLLSLFYLFNGQPIHNEGALQVKNRQEDKQYNDDYESNDSSIDNNNNNSDSESGSGSDDISMSSQNNAESVDSSIDVIKSRAMGMNGPYYRKNNNGERRHNSYRSLGKSSKGNDSHFKVPDVTKNYTDRFVPSDDSDGQNAPVNIPNIKGTEKDKYSVKTLLPQEKEKDWFETIETVDVKNSHLINIYRPIGANTIGSTHKAAIYDIRGLDKAVCPKFVVSPWLQSSYEPDRSSKGICS